MYSESDSVSLNACKHILDISGYSAEQNINIRTKSDSNFESYSDEELENKLVELSEKIPSLKKKLLKH